MLGRHQQRYTSTVVMKLALCVVAGLGLYGCPAEQSAAPDAGGSLAGPTVPPDAGLPPPEACPRGDGTPIVGDINGDGVLDIADPIALENHVFRAGRAPVCRPAADWNLDSRVEADDALRMTTYLVTGAQIPRTLNESSCDFATYWPKGQCAPLALDLHAPARTGSPAFGATVSIRSPTLAIQGWSFSLFAEGCRITRASTQNTIAAEVWDKPPGIRHLGYEATRVLGEDQGAISYVILSTHEDLALPNTAAPIAALEISAELPPAGSCTQCRLSAGDGLTWLGQPIDAVLVADGYAYRPQLPSVTVEVCAP